jgi:formate dehydrogenase subunit gamma
MQHEIERFRTRSRWLHWIMVLAAAALLLTGAVFWVSQWGVAGQDGWTRLIHRIMAVVFVGAPLLCFLTMPGRSLAWIKEVFSWGRDDLEWLKAAPEYYFGGDESRMPPQPHMNSGQKLWALVSVVCGLGLAVTGLIMWFFKGDVAPWVFQWSIFFHDVFVIAGGTMTLVHFYLAAVHPRMVESLKSMFTGKVSAEYAKSHHRKWYQEVTGHKEVAQESPSVEPEA